MAARSLNPAQVFADGVQIKAKPSCVLIACFPHFFDDWISHVGLCVPQCPLWSVFSVLRVRAASAPRSAQTLRWTFAFQHKGKSGLSAGKHLSCQFLTSIGTVGTATHGLPSFVGI